MTDLSITEYRKRASEFLPTVGIKAEFYTSIETNLKYKQPYSASLYPHGVVQSHRGYLRVEADTLAGLWDAMQAQWSKHRDRHREEVTRKMALAIIRFTAELGECTDAALRTEFDPAEIKAYGDDACTEANTMAGRGPFRIKRNAKSNFAGEVVNG